ncbi:hypothetical protein EGW08_019744 [Elysia chlorotica]|uniref:GDNF/GAS1 domain-containing protein n=1 Tax=Elysia chlorotica TaxID=188477 RepID=A0A3S0ZDI2_ELYCH|nr:hypothetical protein EGW08_019744 [Elysia chlorotica]
MGPYIDYIARIRAVRNDGVSEHAKWHFAAELSSGPIAVSREKRLSNGTPQLFHSLQFLIVGNGEHITACPVNCKHALVSLLSTEDNTGHAFINCDCGKDKSCGERKKKVQICQSEVLDSMHVLKDDAPPITCNLARRICEADTSCLAALKYYYDHCSRLFKGIRCSAKCKNSLRILSRQHQANKLRHCKCDGSEDYDCTAVKANTEEMCFRKRDGLKKSEHSSADSSTDTKKARTRRRLRRRKRRNQALKSWRKANRKRRRQRREERKRKQRMRKTAAHGQ